MPRRRFILSEVAKAHQLRITDLRREFGPLAHQTLLDDVKFFRELGFQFELVKDDETNSLLILDVAAPQDDTKESRRHLRALEKHAIGSVLFGLIVGFELQDSKTRAEMLERRSELQKEIGRTLKLTDKNLYPPIPTQQEIIGALIDRSLSLSTGGRPYAPFQHGAAEKAWSVTRLLGNHFSEMRRSVAVDAGTTNEILATLLSNAPIPLRGTSLARLNVTTNSRGIFQTLGNPKVMTKTIMIGGEQVSKSDAVAGPLAELFIQNASILRFGLGILGASFVEVSEGSLRACSDTGAEANVKALLFGKSSLRILAVDHSKFRTEPTLRISYPFAQISPSQVDLIVTSVPRNPSSDLSAEDRQQNEIHWRNFASVIPQILREGVPLLIARPEPSETAGTLITPDGALSLFNNLFPDAPVRDI